MKSIPNNIINLAYLCIEDSVLEEYCSMTASADGESKYSNKSTINIIFF